MRAVATQRGEAQGLDRAWTGPAGAAGRSGGSSPVAKDAKADPLERIARNFDAVAFRQAALMLDQMDASRALELTPLKRAQELAGQAKDYLDRGLLLEAERLYQAAVAVDGRVAEAHAGWREVREWTGDAAGARKGRKRAGTGALGRCVPGPGAAGSRRPAGWTRQTRKSARPSRWNPPAGRRRSWPADRGQGRPEAVGRQQRSMPWARIQAGNCGCNCVDCGGAVDFGCGSTAAAPATDCGQASALGHHPAGQRRRTGARHYAGQLRRSEALLIELDTRADCWTRPAPWTGDPRFAGPGDCVCLAGRRARWIGGLLSAGIGRHGRHGPRHQRRSGPPGHRIRQARRTMNQKIENDAEAFLRSYVTARGRNAEAAEAAVAVVALLHRAGGARPAPDRVIAERHATAGGARRPRNHAHGREQSRCCIWPARALSGASPRCATNCWAGWSTPTSRC